MFDVNQTITPNTKNYTLEELLASSEGQEILDENLKNYIDTDVIEAILEIRYWRYDAEKKETFYTLEDLESAIEDVDKTTYYMSIDDYFDAMDDLLCFADNNSVEARYFDYDAYHRDCEYDITEASNWIVLADW